MAPSRPLSRQSSARRNNVQLTPGELVQTMIALQMMAELSKRYRKARNAARTSRPTSGRSNRAQQRASVRARRSAWR